MSDQSIDKHQAEYQKWKGVVERDYKLNIPALRIAGMPKIHTRKLINDYPHLKEGLNLVEDNEGDIISISDESVENIKLRECFDMIINVLDYYLDIPRDKKVVLALWIIGTYYHEQFETFPYLFLNSMRGSGKTRTLKLITKMAKDGDMLMSMTEAGLFKNEEKKEFKW